MNKVQTNTMLKPCIMIWKLVLNVFSNSQECQICYSTWTDITRKSLFSPDNQIPILKRKMDLTGMCLSCYLTSYLGNSTKILVIFFFKEKQHDQTDKVMYFMNNTLLKAFNLCYIPHNHNLQCLLKQWLSTKHLESLSILSLSSLH